MLHRNYLILGLILFINYPVFFECVEFVGYHQQRAKMASDRFNEEVLPRGRQLLLMNKFGQLLEYCSDKDKKFKTLPGIDHEGTANEFRRLFATVKSVSDRAAYSIIFLVTRPGYHFDEMSALENSRIIFSNTAEADLVDMRILCEYFKRNFIAINNADLTQLFKSRFQFLSKKIQEEINERRERTEHSSRYSSCRSSVPSCSSRTSSVYSELEGCFSNEDIRQRLLQMDIFKEGPLHQRLLEDGERLIEELRERLDKRCARPEAPQD